MAQAFLDPANYLTTLKAIIKDVQQYNGGGAGGATTFGYYRQTTNKIQGFYWDLYGGGGNVTPYQNAPSLNPNGNSGSWETNKADLAVYARAQMRLLDASFYQTTENVEEGLLGAFDAMHLGGIGETSLNEWGINGGNFSIVFSRFCAMFDLGITLNDTAYSGIPNSQADFYAAWVNAAFHLTGGKICISNGKANSVICPVDPPGIADCPQFNLVAFAKSIIDNFTATPVMKTYMQTGYRCRPLPASWEGDQMEQALPLSEYMAGAGTATEGVERRISSSVWRNPAADPNFPSTSNCLGIIITSTLTSDTTYNIQIDPAAYDLSPTSVKVLYLRTGTTRTEITRFTDYLDIDVDVTFTFPNAPIYLYEVVQLP